MGIKKSFSKIFRTFKKSEAYIVDGKRYGSLQEMPIDVRNNFEKLRRQTLKDAREHQVTTTSYEYNGTKYDSIEEMPPHIRRLFRDANQNGVPDSFED